MNVSVLEILYYTVMLGAGSFSGILLFSLMAREFVSQVRIRRRELRLAEQEERKRAERQARLDMRKRLQEEILARQAELQTMEQQKLERKIAREAKRTAAAISLQTPPAPRPQPEPAPPKPQPAPAPAKAAAVSEKKKPAEDVKASKDVRRELEEKEMEARRRTEADLMAEKLQEDEPDRLAGLVRTVMHSNRD
jgi:flagellar biosynthesis/type III secretory pathway M-ring protein FliF/YscJ